VVLVDGAAEGRQRRASPLHVSVLHEHVVGRVGREREDGDVGVGQCGRDACEKSDEFEREHDVEGQASPAVLDLDSVVVVVSVRVCDDGYLATITDGGERVVVRLVGLHHGVRAGRDGDGRFGEGVRSVHTGCWPRPDTCVLVSHGDGILKPPCYLGPGMPGPVFLQGDGVSLHPVAEDDLEFLLDTVMDPNVRQTLGIRQPFTLKQEQEWYEEHASSDERVDLVICIPHDDVPDAIEPADDENEHVRVGSIGLGPMNDLDGKAEIGISVAEPFWGHGYGTEAARLITNYAFRDLRKHRVVARVFDGNVGSQRIWEKLGYEHEAVHRDEQFMDGEYVDVHYYSVLENEWLDRT